MAYTIISQNNTTTTLADENGNVITVPARVTLATSTDYTITKVNNNSVDLVDGNGKVIRGVPACVVLVGDGGGSGDEYLPLAGGTMTGDIKFESGGIEGGYVGAQGGYIRIGSGATPSNDDLYFDDKVMFYGATGGKIGTGQFPIDTVHTQKLNNGANITVPANGGVMALQESTMPTAASGNEGLVVQYIGATDANYTNGYFYKCVSDGQDPATYSWEAVQVQAGGGGASYTAGNGISIDANNEISVTDPVLVNKATGINTGAIIVGDQVGTSTVTDSVVIGNGSSTQVHGGSVAIGYNAASSANAFTVCIGEGSQTSQNYGIAIGRRSKTFGAGAIQIGGSGNSTGYTNSDDNTFKVGNANGNFEIMSADGTVPTDRFTTSPVADGTYVPTLTISSGVATRSWAAPASGTSSISVTLPAADWSGSAQTVTATGVTASNTVIVGAAPASQAEYTTCGVICTAQGTDSLTFTCTSTPTNDLSVTVLILA